jgi:hypothetical protein
MAEGVTRLFVAGERRLRCPNPPHGKFSAMLLPSAGCGARGPMIKIVTFAFAAFLSNLVEPAFGQDCSPESIRKWGEFDNAQNPNLKPGQGKLVTDAKECSKVRLREYLSEVDTTLPDKAGLQKLNALRNSYGNLDLVWLDKNILYQAIGEKVIELEKKFVDHKCQPVISDIRIPNELADAVLVSRDPTLSFSRFICAATVHSGDLKIESASLIAPDMYKVSFSGGYLKFRVKRPSSYLKNAKKTVTVETVGNANGEQPADEAILHYLYGEFSASMQQFLAQ